MPVSRSIRTVSASFCSSVGSGSGLLVSVRSPNDRGDVEPDEADRGHVGDAAAQVPPQTAAARRLVALDVRQRLLGAAVGDHDRGRQSDDAGREEDLHLVVAPDGGGVEDVERGRRVLGPGEGSAECTGGQLQSVVGGVQGLVGASHLPVPLVLSGVGAVVGVMPRVRCTPGVLIPERQLVVARVGLDHRAVRDGGTAQQGGGGPQGRRVRQVVLGLPSEADRRSGRAHAVCPPVVPVAPIGRQRVPVPFDGGVEEGLVGGDAQVREHPPTVPFLDDVADGPARTGVVRPAAVGAQVQDVPAERRSAVGVRASVEPAEDAAQGQRVRPGTEGGEVGREHVGGDVVRLVEPDHRPLHVGQAVGGVGAPDDQLAALGADPAEQPRHGQLTCVVGVGATGPVVGDAEVAHSEPGQGVGQPDDLAGDVGLHGHAEVEPVPPLQIEGRCQELVQLIGAAHLGVQVERHRRERYPVLPDPVQQLGVPGGRPVRQPLGDGVQGLLVPTEPGGLAQGVGVPHQPQGGVEVVDVLGAHDVLPVRVADVVVAVLDQVDVVVPGPLQDGGQLDGRIGDADHQLRRAVDLRDEEPKAAGPDRLVADGHLGAAQPDPDQRRVERSLASHHLEPYGLQEAVAVGRDQGFGDQSDGHSGDGGLGVHRVGDDLGSLERGVPDRAGREDGVGGHGRAFRWGFSVPPGSGRRQGTALVSLPRVYATDRPAAGQVVDRRVVRQRGTPRHARPRGAAWRPVGDRPSPQSPPTRASAR